MDGGVRGIKSGFTKWEGLIFKKFAKFVGGLSFNLSMNESFSVII